MILSGSCARMLGDRAIGVIQCWMILSRSWEGWDGRGLAEPMKEASDRPVEESL